MPAPRLPVHHRTFIDFGDAAGQRLSQPDNSATSTLQPECRLRPRCIAHQLVDQPQRERMFNDRYPFFYRQLGPDARPFRLAG